MRSQFSAVLRDIDGRLPSYFLIKGGRIHPIPDTRSDYERLVESGYEHIVDSVDYGSLDSGIIRAINGLINELGQRTLLLFPLAVSAIISHEASREGSPLYIALYGSGDKETKDQAEEGRVQEYKGKKRKGK